MPILNLKVSAVPSPELSEKLAGGLVEVTARVLRKRPEITAVAIDYTSPDHWIVGGQSLA